jgi:hypothetical protein
MPTRAGWKGHIVIAETNRQRVLEPNQQMRSDNRGAHGPVNLGGSMLVDALIWFWWLVQWRVSMSPLGAWWFSFSTSPQAASGITPQRRQPIDDQRASPRMAA